MPDKRDRIDEGYAPQKIEKGYQPSRRDSDQNNPNNGYQPERQSRETTDPTPPGEE